MADEDDRRIQAILGADAQRVARTAGLPTAQTVLWRAKVRAVHRRRGRVAWAIAFVETLAIAGLVLLMMALSWKRLLESPVTDHALTVTLFGALTIIALGVLLAIPLTGTRPGSSST
jgi:hypothetical protein